MCFPEGSRSGDGVGSGPVEVWGSPSPPIRWEGTVGWGGRVQSSPETDSHTHPERVSLDHGLDVSLWN